MAIGSMVTAPVACGGRELFGSNANPTKREVRGTRRSKPPEISLRCGLRGRLYLRQWTWLMSNIPTRNKKPNHPARLFGIFIDGWGEINDKMGIIECLVA